MSEVYEVKEIKVSSVYPLVWFGEKTISVRGIGRLVEVNYLWKNEDRRFIGVQRIAWSETSILPFPQENDTVIILGGIYPPKIVRFVGIVWCVRREVNLLRDYLPEGMEMLVPAGVGYKTQVLLYYPVVIPLEDLELEDNEGIEVYSPPTVYWIEKVEDRIIMKELTDC